MCIRDSNLTVGKKTYAQVEPEVYMRLEKLADLRGRLLSLVGADVEAFGPLAAAYRMPKDTPEQLAAKQAAIQDALILSLIHIFSGVRSSCATSLMNSF